MSKLLRGMLAIFLILVLMGSGYGAYKFYTHMHDVRVAVESLDGDDAILLTELSKRLVTNRSRVRIRLIVSGGQQESSNLVRDRKADVASIRADGPIGERQQTIMVLYQAYAVLSVPEKSRIEDWKNLNRKTVALTGRLNRDDPLLAFLLKSNGVTDVNLVSLPPEKEAATPGQRLPQGVMFVSSFPAVTTKNPKQNNVERALKLNPNFVEVGDAETLAAANKRYQSVTLIAGALRQSPRIPAESSDTLAVSRHLVVDRHMSQRWVINFLTQIMEARRSLLGSLPVLATTGAPDLEADAFVPVHGGAATYFNNEIEPISQVLFDNIYLVPMVLGAIGSCLVWLYNFLWPGKRDDLSHVNSDLMALMSQARACRSPEDFSAVQEQLTNSLKRVHDLYEADRIEENEMSGLLNTVALIDMRLLMDRQQGKFGT